ncbi:MAG: hypothetical protein ACQET3_13090 [Promethearchaeati archaeon]
MMVSIETMIYALLLQVLGALIFALWFRFTKTKEYLESENLSKEESEEDSAKKYVHGLGVILLSIGLELCSFLVLCPDMNPVFFVIPMVFFYVSFQIMYRSRAKIPYSEDE